MPNSKPLKNRTNIVLCEAGVSIEGCICVHSIDELLIESKKYPADDFFIIGGASVYKTMLPYCDKVMLTKVNAIGGAEVFFPNLDTHPNFELISSTEPVIDNGVEICFTVYKNNSIKQF